ncbi:1-deoxy-D-xylulose 5-phosphate reductoisomerase [Paraglaciecola sp. T6c]|uniref:1-deoxy-D-xylulose-5-phosphate reductoisomerase n=1 Tax=Pseudoalteromonas atlantica (strain T6c / ATCC BAA-1087) TaxID=3042615 RepID=UPI00005C69DE|nr:1-deoxy-D-xylulose-5-phosphate reductoisomerase [Paraglaciecola sp. T6c]ABG39781.1 1-deoxy-D-xylulose 5-phosphate reductoisomerase [Paraglaciecola sp. T6c]
MQNICILGATGSIGQSTIDVVLRHPGLYQVYALTAHSQIDKLLEQAKLCQPKYLVLSDSTRYQNAKQALLASGIKTELLSGAQALADVASADEVDVVMAAIVGGAGLLPTIAAVKAGKKVLLANKESLVMSGELFINAAKEHGATILPIDSEHNAIFQCLPHDFQYGDLAASGISSILLTGSGGPFRETPLNRLSEMTPAQACAHPNWDMGQKISVDSATMMNKGLEFIEARWLFGLQTSDIKVVLHPQSIIHSMVQYCDGSVLAQMGNPDMRTPIAHGLAFPKRIDSGVKPLDFQNVSNFSFDEPEPQRYPNLYLAIEASDAGQYATTALNAANEVAVAAFLSGQIGFSQIAQVNQQCVAKMQGCQLDDINAIVEWDKECRRQAQQIISSYSREAR